MIKNQFNIHLSEFYVARNEWICQNMIFVIFLHFKRIRNDSIGITNWSSFFAASFYPRISYFCTAHKICCRMLRVKCNKTTKLSMVGSHKNRWAILPTCHSVVVILMIYIESVNMFLIVGLCLSTLRPHNLLTSRPPTNFDLLQPSIVKGDFFFSCAPF